jgi:large subunit ribosomal protein L10
LAYTKEKKAEVIDRYEQWARSSQAIYFVSFAHMTMADINDLRAKARPMGCELHVAKNTLLRRVFGELGLSEGDLLEGSSLVGFATGDPAATAKLIVDSGRNAEKYTIKGGILAGVTMGPEQVHELAELPSLPVMRGRLLGMFQAPMSQLARTVVEPGRRLAYVLGQFSEKAAPQANA